MLQVIISVDLNTRLKNRNREISKQKGEIIYLDDTNSSFSSLQSYIYPSLFSTQAPFIHAKNLLEEFSNEITKEIIKSLVESPTIFFLEETSVPSNFLKMIEKEGGVVSNIKPINNKVPDKANIFLATNAITTPNKKDRWLYYRKALENHPIEAIIGILYWKLRDMISKSKIRDPKLYKIYNELMLAHKNSWQQGFSLELAIEKVILAI